MTSVNSLIDQRSQLHPNKIAVRHNDKTFSYQQIVTQSNQLARFFQNNGLNTNDVAGIAIDRSGEMLIALISVMKIGVAYLPIDNEIPIERIKYMLEDASVKTLITSKKYQDKYADIANVVFIEDALQASVTLDSESLEPQTDPDRLTYILYTSGSTGKPKGVGIKHSSLLNLLLSVQESPGMDENDIFLFTTTISFDIAELEMYLPLMSGGCAIIADADKVKDSRELLALAKAENVTIMQGAPFMWRIMIEGGWVDPLPIKIFCGGEAMTRDLADKLLVRSKEVWNMYGPTETTIYSIIKNVQPGDDLITIGKAIRNTDLYFLDEDLNEVEKGNVGEICIGGDGVADGYLNRPELTSEKFIKDTFTNKEGRKVYRTGDLGKVLENGDILCLGRIDHQIKIRGIRIESEEIEIQLKQQNNIKEAVISSYKDSLNNIHLVAYIVPFEPIADTAKTNAINSWNDSLSVVLPAYMIPDRYMIIPSLPLMLNGKLDRKALPEPIYQVNEETYQEAETDIEAALVKIGLKYIAVPKIGVTDNLFELGVDSLVGVRIMVQIEKEFGKRLPLSVLVKYPTIRQLAQVIQNGVPESDYKFLIPLKETGTKVPLYIIHGIGLNLLNLHEMILNVGDDQPVYGLQSVGLDGTMAVPDNLEDVAHLYIEEIIKHNPTGPYCIAGYSFGGYIAFEIVKQLKAENKEVKLLAMFDTNLQYPTYQYSFFKKFLVKGIRQFKKLFFRTSTFVADPVKTFDYLGKSLGYFEDYDPEGMPDFMLEIADKLTQDFFRYQFKPYNVKISLFKAKERLFFVDDPKYLGWGKYALDGVEVFEVSGDHKEMFGAKNAKKLADVLQKKLDNI